MSDFLRRNRHFNLNQFIAAALREDVRDGDHTSLATVPASQNGRMKLLVKQEGIIAGVQAAKAILKFCDPKCKVRVLIGDGARVQPGDVVLRVEGNSRKLLKAERTLLNVMQRMSGIATKTARLQALCAGAGTKVIDTRKTTPGFRYFEKWAVVIGGGANHRFGLYDMILIKDNHIDFAGGIPQAIDAVKKYQKKKGLRLPVEIETRSITELRQVLDHGGVQRVMLDNFDVASTVQAVKLVAGRLEVESSGGITEMNIGAYAKCGVDFISVGALTHQISSLDLSLKAEP